MFGQCTRLPHCLKNSIHSHSQTVTNPQFSLIILWLASVPDSTSLYQMLATSRTVKTNTTKPPKFQLCKWQRTYPISPHFTCFGHTSHSLHTVIRNKSDTGTGEFVCKNQYLKPQLLASVFFYTEKRHIFMLKKLPTLLYNGQLLSCISVQFKLPIVAYYYFFLGIYMENTTK